MGGELNHFARTVVQVVLVISFIIAGKNTMSTFGWGAGAEIAAPKHIRAEGVVYAAGASQDSQSGD